MKNKMTNNSWSLLAKVWLWFVGIVFFGGLLTLLTFSLYTAGGWLAILCFVATVAVVVTTLLAMSHLDPYSGEDI